MIRLRILEKFYLALHRRRYASRLKRQKRYHEHHVIAVGNLSAGGTGKSPVTRSIAQTFINLNPLILLRGYEGEPPPEGILVSEGNGPLVSAELAGDEAIFMSDMSGLSVAAGKERTLLMDRFAAGHKLILLDDAFQNPSVYHNHELVLLDASTAPEDIRVFPTGTFREEPDALKRAHTILFTRCDRASKFSLNSWNTYLKQEFPSIPCFYSSHKVEDIVSALDLLEKRKLRDKSRSKHQQNMIAFCGIANGKSFFQSAESVGVTTKARVTFRDHHSYSQTEIESLTTLALSKGTRLLTTEKDFARIRHKNTLPMEFWELLDVLRIGIDIDGTSEHRNNFFKRLLISF